MIAGDSDSPLIGRRVKLLRAMTNPGSKWLPVEDGMPAGLEGTITYADMSGPLQFQQLGVRWDNGRTLGLIPHVDAFELLPVVEEAAHAST